MCTRGHIGVVYKHKLYTAQILLLNLLEVGVEAISGVEAVLHNLTTRESYRCTVGGVARVGNQNLVTLIEECHADVHDTLLRAKQGQYLGLGVEFHVIPLLIPVSVCLTQELATVVGLICVYIGTLCLLCQAVDNGLCGGHVGATDTKTDNIAASLTKFGYLAVLL